MKAKTAKATMEELTKEEQIGIFGGNSTNSVSVIIRDGKIVWVISSNAG